MATQIRQVPDQDTLVKITTAQVREKIACDRALIYRFNSDDSGVVLAESKTVGWTPASREKLPAIIFGLVASRDYLAEEFVAIEDTNKIEITPYQLQLLDKFQIKASLSIPILLKDEIWGLLVVQNCVAPRQWQEVEISLLSQITTELIHKLQDFEFEKKLQQQQVKHTSITKVIEKIQRASSLERIFQTTTQEVRQLLQCDRVAIYRFNSDWSGEFIAESVGNEWVKVVGPGIKTVWEDTHLQETQGGRYRNNETFIVNDIY